MKFYSAYPFSVLYSTTGALCSESPLCLLQSYVGVEKHELFLYARSDVNASERITDFRDKEYGIPYCIYLQDRLQHPLL